MNVKARKLSAREREHNAKGEAYRAYYRDGANGHWQPVCNRGGYPIVYTTREAALAAAQREIEEA